MRRTKVRMHIRRKGSRRIRVRSHRRSRIDELKSGIRGPQHNVSKQDIPLIKEMVGNYLNERKVKIRDIDVVGSRTIGRAKATSDIDVVVKLDVPENKSFLEHMPKVYADLGLPKWEKPKLKFNGKDIDTIFQ